MQKIVALILFFFPSWLAFPLVHLLRRDKFTYGKKSKIRFSIIIADEIHLNDYSYVGSFNIIIVPEMHLEERAKIKHLNIIKGRFTLRMGKLSCINKSCQIVSKLNNIRHSQLQIGINSIIGVSHTLDLTHNIIIGSNSILAGVRSQIWTHGFYHPQHTYDHWRIDGPVLIGDNDYIGSGVIICAGLKIEDNITIGAGCVVSKSLSKEGLYVGGALRFIEFNPASSIKKYTEIAPNIYEK